MTVAQLIERLKEYDQNLQIMVDDGVGPREINLGPIIHKVTAAEGDDLADCEEIVGETIVKIGVGNY